MHALTREPLRCITGSCPTIDEVNDAYGEGTAQALMVTYVDDICTFSGVSGKVSPFQMAQLADIICRKYGRLKISEMLLFFSELKAGVYGHFYGAVDPMVIMESIRSFARERDAVIERKMTEDYLRERESDRLGSISYEEYLSRKEARVNQNWQ